MPVGEVSSDGLAFGCEPDIMEGRCGAGPPCPPRSPQPRSPLSLSPGAPPRPRSHPPGAPPPSGPSRPSSCRCTRGMEAVDNGESRGRVGGGRKEVVRATTGKSLARAGKPTVRKIEREPGRARDAPCGIDRRDPWGDRSPRGLACTCPPKRRAQRAEASSAVRGARGGTLDCTPKGDGSRRVSEHIFRHR